MTSKGFTQDQAIKHLGDVLNEVVKEARQAAGKSVPSTNIFTGGAPRDAAVNLWEFHWLKHQAEFPNYGPVDYALAALEHIETPASTDVLVKTITNKFGLQEKVVINLNNGYFSKQMVSGSETGALKTFFVRNGTRQQRIDYFNKQ